MSDSLKKVIQSAIIRKLNGENPIESLIPGCEMVTYPTSFGLSMKYTDQDCVYLMSVNFRYGGGSYSVVNVTFIPEEVVPRTVKWKGKPPKPVCINHTFDIDQMKSETEVFETFMSLLEGTLLYMKRVCRKELVAQE